MFFDLRNKKTAKSIFFVICGGFIKIIGVVIVNNRHFVQTLVFRRAQLLVFTPVRLLVFRGQRYCFF